MVIHNLKSWRHLFVPMFSGEKKFDLRNDDRNFQVGDMVLLQEYDGLMREYTGRELLATIAYITRNSSRPCVLSPNALNDNYCILSLEYELC
jgi:hypothetical protein